MALPDSDIVAAFVAALAPFLTASPCRLRPPGHRSLQPRPYTDCRRSAVQTPELNLLVSMLTVLLRAALLDSGVLLGFHNTPWCLRDPTWSLCDAFVLESYGVPGTPPPAQALAAVQRSAR